MQHSRSYRAFCRGRQVWMKAADERRWSRLVRQREQRRSRQESRRCRCRGEPPPGKRCRCNKLLERTRRAAGGKKNGRDEMRSRKKPIKTRSFQSFWCFHCASIVVICSAATFKIRIIKSTKLSDFKHQDSLVKPLLMGVRPAGLLSTQTLHHFSPRPQEMSKWQIFHSCLHDKTEEHYV